MFKKIKLVIKSIFVILMFLLIYPVFTYCEYSKILIDDNPINIETIISNEKVYVPIDTISKALGAEIQYDQVQNIVIIKSKDNDEILPKILEAVSPSVIGVIGSLKDGSEYSDKYKDQIAHGTGVIVKSNGEILTNTHVVKDMERIVVVLSDGSGYEAKLKYSDEDTDLALIKIEKEGLQPVKFGKQEDIIIGKTVIAIGTPVSFSLRNSASKGIVSGINRVIGSTYRLIQTDAAINPGNSGGPLVNLKGEVIGINSNKYAGVGIEGLGFSIPVDTINFVLNHFEKYGKVKRSTLGVLYEEDWAAKMGLPTNNGLKVIRVEKNEQLKEGDVLRSINGSSINTIVDINEKMKKYLPGDNVDLKIERKGIVQCVNCILGEKYQ